MELVPANVWYERGMGTGLGDWGDECSVNNGIMGGRRGKIYVQEWSTSLRIIPFGLNRHLPNPPPTLIPPKYTKYYKYCSVELNMKVGNSFYSSGAQESVFITNHQSVNWWTSTAHARLYWNEHVKRHIFIDFLSIFIVTWRQLTHVKPEKL